jgi:hypothetical protein
MLLVGKLYQHQNNYCQFQIIFKIIFIAVVLNLCEKIVKKNEVLSVEDCVKITINKMCSF